MARRKKEIPQDILAVYEAEGWIDRYTVVFDPTGWDITPGHHPLLTLSTHPDSPLGVSQFTERVRGRHLGKRIRFRDLPPQVQDHVLKRFREADPEEKADGSKVTSSRGTYEKDRCCMSPMPSENRSKPMWELWS